jgi:hypothetical protein
MRYLTLIALLLTACQNNNPKFYIVTCRKPQSYIDVLGIANKYIMMYMDDSTQINFQHLERPYKYNIYLRCQDTLIRISNRLYKVLQKQPSLYDCSYKNIISECLKNPRDTIYTWSEEIHTTLIVSDSIQDEVSIIDIIIPDKIYEQLFSNNAFVLSAANATAYCDCPVLGYLISKPNSKYRIKEVTIKHYLTNINDKQNE